MFKSECLNPSVKSKHWSFNGSVFCIRVTLACSDMDIRLFHCILRIASTKSLLGSCCLYNVEEKSLIEGECELNYQKHRGQGGKKDLIFLHLSTILTQKSMKLSFFVDF